MGTWENRASRILTLFEGNGTEEGDRTWQIMNHVLDETHGDGYVSRDFFNVQQTAGGLPDGISMTDYLGLIMGNIRRELEGSGFDESLSDDELSAAALSFDDNIRRHIRFLNGVVHQGAPGEVHVALWNLIISSRDDDNSLYACYRDFLVDA